MNPAESALVAAGVIFGGTVVAVLVAVSQLRRRPPEIRLTVTHNALPRRDAATLDRSDPIGVRVGEPDLRPIAVQVGTGADPVLHRLVSGSTPQDNTALEHAAAPRAGVVPVIRDPLVPPRVEWHDVGLVGKGSRVLSFGLAAPAPGSALEAVSTAAVPRLRAPALVGARAEAGGGSVAADMPAQTDGAGATPAPAATGGDPAGRDLTASRTPPQGERPEDTSAAGTADDPLPDGPCASEQRTVAERCAVASRARELHEEELARHRQLQREYDGISARIDAAVHAMDGRRVMEAKEAARRSFRAERLAADTGADVETAATRWLATINELNVHVRDAQRVVTVERRRATRLLAVLEAGETRLDVKRIAAETAEHRCHEAREALAACQELHAARLTAASLSSARAAQVVREKVMDEEPGGPAVGGPASAGQPVPDARREPATRPDQAPAQGAPEEPDLLAHVVTPGRTVLSLILEGDDQALESVATQLGAGVVEETRRWHLELAALRDACRAAAIGAGVIDLPADDGFWASFSPREAREIAVALASLGFRYDGRSGFADGRVPSTRDLALAVGYAGLDPRRVRRWPSVEQLPGLLAFAEVPVAAFVATGAPDLTLGQMVALLGRQATTLAALWDEWGRARPLLARSTEVVPPRS